MAAMGAWWTTHSSILRTTVESILRHLTRTWQVTIPATSKNKTSEPPIKVLSTSQRAMRKLWWRQSQPLDPSASPSMRAMNHSSSILRACTLNHSATVSSLIMEFLPSAMEQTSRLSKTTGSSKTRGVSDFLNLIAFGFLSCDSLQELHGATRASSGWQETKTTLVESPPKPAIHWFKRLKTCSLFTAKFS